MANGLYKRGSVWWMSTDPVTRKPRSTRCRDRRAAESYRAEREHRAADPAYGAATDATLDEWCGKLLAAKSTNCSEATASVYRQKLGHWLRVLGRDCTLAQVTPEAVDRFVAQRRAERITDHTITKELSTLVQLLKLAKRVGCYPGDIAALKPLDLHASYSARKRALTPGELIALLSVLSSGHAAFVAIAAGLGATLSEAFRLLPSDVDMAAGTVHIRGTKRPGRNRVVPMLSLYRPLLARALPYLPLHPWRDIQRELAAACRRAGIDRCTPNDLRRTHATLLQESGLDRDILRRLLGHTTTAMVDTVYGQPRPEALGVLAEEQLAREGGAIAKALGAAA